MKKSLQSLLSFVLAMLMFSVQTMAITSTMPSNGSTAEATFDESEIYDAFADVNNLVVALEDNQDLSYAELQATNSDLLVNVNSSAAIAMNTSSDANPPFISAFLWGCIFNLPGMLVVGLTTGFDGNQLTKSAWGCLINSLLFGGGIFSSNL
jgi:hypothetical protein